MAVSEALRRTLRVCSLYPDLMNIYADRGNLLMLERRCAWRGIGFELVSSGLGDALEPDAGDLFYIGGGQDREQALIAPDLAARGDAIREAVDGGAAVLAVCGGYQLLGRFYRDLAGAELAGAGLFPLQTVAGERRMIGDCLLECELDLVSVEQLHREALTAGLRPASTRAIEATDDYVASTVGMLHA